MELSLNTLRDSGFFRVAAVVPEISLANPRQNALNAITAIQSCGDADVYVLPELSTTGYTCADLFNQTFLLDASDKALQTLADFTMTRNIVIIAGAPVRHLNHLLNCAVVIYDGKLVACVPKTHIPNYNEFYERRWFQSSEVVEDEAYAKINGDDVPIATTGIFDFYGVRFGIEICEDLWVPSPPSSKLAMMGADIICNLSASNEVLGKHRYLVDLIRQQSARCRCGYVYSSAGCGESSTDLVFSGNAIIAEDGAILKESPRFQRNAFSCIADIDVEKLRSDRRRFNTFGEGVTPDSKNIYRLNTGYDTGIVPFPYKENPTREWIREVTPHPFVPASKTHKDENCSEIIEIQCWGLQQRLESIGCNKLVVGISGGLDSTLALLVACRTFDRMGKPRNGITGITMPGLATTSRTRGNAHKLMELLGVTTIEIPIGKAVAQHFSDIGQDPERHDAAFENSQARERTQILMDYANKCGGIVLGTGDLSELALGWATYNGDHMSMYGINASIPKTLVRHLVEWFAERAENPELSDTLRSIIDTPISPELVPAKDEEEIAQKTEELVGPYELHDFFLYNMLRNSFSPKKIYLLALEAFHGRYSGETILKWEKNFYRRFFSQQFKRSCMPDGPKVGSVCLSPRGDWRMPSDAKSALWLAELENSKEFTKFESDK